MKDLFPDITCNSLVNDKIGDSVLNSKIVDLSKLKAFADVKVNVIQDMKVVSHRIGNIVKGENAGCHNVFQTILSKCLENSG